MNTLNKITINNKSQLNTSKYTVWVAGFIEQQNSAKQPVFWYLQPNGSFALSVSNTGAFMAINNGITVDVPDVVNYGNNRLVFTITENTSPSPAPLSPVKGYTAYPFNNKPGVCPPGPYDIFEFGPNAQYDVSAVDSFGLNLSFNVKGDAVTYGAIPTISREQIGKDFGTFVNNDPLGKGFDVLLYTSPKGNGYPDQIEKQFSAIVSPKDWLGIYSTATHLSNFWDQTIDSFFTAGNQLDFFLNAATVGNYSGTSNGTQYTLTGPGGLQIVIPAADFKDKNQGFMQAVRAQKKGESNTSYAVFGQIEAAFFEALSRGVLLDGVVPAGKSIATNQSSDAWINTSNWYSNHQNAYNGKASVYDVYAKFFHLGGVFGLNSGGQFGMAYGFSLDENPNIGNTWAAANNIPSKTDYNVGSGQDVTLVIGPW